MSLYQLNKVMYLLELDAVFLAAMKRNPAAAVRDLDLTHEERSALLCGDVSALYLMGVNLFILDSIARHELFGMTREAYLQQIRDACKQPKPCLGDGPSGTARLTS